MSKSLASSNRLTRACPSKSFAVQAALVSLPFTSGAPALAAWSLVGLSRDSYRNPPQPDQLTRDLGERIVDIVHVRRRFGYRRFHDLLRSEFPGVNHKRVYRLYNKRASQTSLGCRCIGSTSYKW